jgi:plasmid stabilization system protein ParE
MPRLIWSRAALVDISRLYAFLVSKNPLAARRAVAAIRQGVKLLSQHPEAGRPIAEMPPEFREWPIEFGSGGYVALYRFDGTQVTILAVKHGGEAGY